MNQLHIKEAKGIMNNIVVHYKRSIKLGEVEQLAHSVKRVEKVTKIVQ